MSQTFSIRSNQGSTARAVSSTSTLGGSVQVTNRIAEDLVLLLNSSAATLSVAEATTGSAAASAASRRNSTISSNGVVLSQIELAILRSTEPIEISETEEITVIGQRGIWSNKAEVQAWQGDIAISEYLINEDQNPEIINRKITQQIEYVQEMLVRYLKPPTPPAPGEIVITMEPNIPTGPAPPLIIRQQPPRADTPEPLVVREAPPEPPKPVGPKLITISGKRLPPPPRKVIIERLAPLPSKPQNVIIERWLPYGETKRRVIFNKPTQADPVMVTPRNIIVQWEAPDVNVRQEVKYLGVVKANPVEYVEKYGDSLQLSSALPKFVLDIQTPSEVGVLAADHKAKSLIELEGQLEGFQYVNLDHEGLGEYRAYLAGLGIKDLGSEVLKSSSSASVSAAVASSSASAVTSASSASTSSVANAALQIFSMIDSNNNGFISVSEAERIILRINSRLNRNYGENDVKAFFAVICDGNTTITKEQFVSAFERLSKI
jgi:hypothetical protein